MVTRRCFEKEEYMFLNVKLVGDASGDSWFAVDLINNTFPSGISFNQNLPLAQQPWVNSIQFFKQDQIKEAEEADD